MTSIDEIASRCDKVRWRGRHSFEARCAAHDDRNPSMTVTEAEDGKILAHCHAGCPQDAVLDALGMRRQKLSDNNFKPAKAPRRETKPRTYDYALAIWKSASPADDGVRAHPYAVRKRITYAFGARRGTASGSLIGRDADCILLPNRDWEGHVVGVECINADGVKQTFGSKGLLVLGHPEGADLVHVCEGWATAFAIGKLFPLPFAAIVTFGKGKMNLYANEAQIRYRGVVVLHEEANNRDVWDLWTDGEGEAYASRVQRRAAHA